MGNKKTFEEMSESKMKMRFKLFQIEQSKGKSHSQIKKMLTDF